MEYAILVNYKFHREKGNFRKLHAVLTGPTNYLTGPLYQLFFWRPILPVSIEGDDEGVSIATELYNRKIAETYRTVPTQVEIPN